MILSGRFSYYRRGRSQVQGTKRGYSYLQGGYAEDPPAFCWKGRVLQPGHGAGRWSLSKGCLDRMHLISCSSIVIATLISLAVSFHISRYARPLHLPASACLLSSCLLGRISMFFHLSCSSVCSSVFHRPTSSPPFTIIVPDIQPRRFWWVLLQAPSIDQFLLGKRVTPRSCFSHLVQLWNG